MAKTSNIESFKKGLLKPGKKKDAYGMSTL